MEPESKKYSWAWVTANRQLSHGPCELMFAYMIPSGAEDSTILYNGTGITGDVITYMVSAFVLPQVFRPLEPVYCEKGLYVVKGSATTGIFVMWREL